MSEMTLPGDSDEWVIAIAGYGSFLFRGNEADARFMCKGKAQWEGAAGEVWRANDRAFGLPPSASLTAVNARGALTIAALEQAVARPNGVATWRNYGRSPESEAALKSSCASDQAPAGEQSGSAQDNGAESIDG